jgi:hypothetical protein
MSESCSDSWLRSGSSPLAVVSQQVVVIDSGSADGRILVEASMWSMPVVLMRPWLQVFESLC